MRKSKFFNTHKEISATLLPNLTEPTNDQDYLRVRYTEFCPYWNINVERKVRNSFKPVNEVLVLRQGFL